MKVTLVALTLNEIEGMKAVMPLIKPEWCDQIIVSDGGSTDGTIEWARAQGYEVYVQQKKGIRFAYLEILDKIKGDVIVTFSPDGNCPADAIPKLIGKIEEGYDLVIGSRYYQDATSEDDDAITGFGNWLFTRTVNILHGGRYSDAMVIYRAFKKELIAELDLDKHESYELPERLFGTVISWEPLMSVRAAKARKKIADVAVGEPDRIGGTRKLQILRWGAAYYFQFWRELWFWRRSISDRSIAIAVSAAASIGYFLWRWSPFIVWDDTSGASYNAFANGRRYSFAPPGFLGRTLTEVFGHLQGDGYRPLSALIRYTGNAYFANGARDPWLFISLNAIVIGLLAGVYYRWARRFTIGAPAAIFSVLLFLWSTPILTGSLVLFSGIQALVPLLICGGLLCYEAACEPRGRRAFWLVALMAILFCGPLVREFVGVLPVLIILIELMRYGRPTALAACAALFFIHALFPTAAVRWLFFPELPLTPVFKIGNLGAFGAAGPGQSLAAVLWNLHWRLFLHIPSIYPPSLLILAALGAVFGDRNKEDLQRTLFLTVFFLMTFLPFLKLFNEQVHLAYSLVPASVLIAVFTEKLAVQACVIRRWGERAALAFAASLLIVSLDHAANVYAVREVTRAIYEGIQFSARWFTENVPRGSPVISNAHHLEDVRFFSANHIDPWGAPGGIPDTSRWMHGPSDLQKLLDERRGKPVYFFDVTVKQPQGQRHFGRDLFFLRNENVDVEHLGTIRITEAVYPYFDPLKSLVPIDVVAWPGPPDLEFDFYRGPAFGHSFGLRQVYASYDAFRVAGNRVFTQAPRLIEQDFHGFNIIGFHGRVFAIPQAEGAFTLDRVKNRGYSRSFEEATLARVRRAVVRSAE